MPPLRRFLRISFAAVTAATIAACATSPLGRSQLKLVSDSQVTQMGVQAFTELKKEEKVVSSGSQVSRVQCVARSITAAVPKMNWNVPVPSSWEVVVFDSEDVNAFALPGGKIGVYTGLLKVATTPDQLAAVVGHEVSHVLAGHSAERVSQQVAAQVGVGVAQAAGGSGQIVGAGIQALILLPFSRTQETEADLLGMDLMATAGFDPASAVTLWQNMSKANGGKQPPQWASTHPSNQTRIKNLNERLSRDRAVYQQAQSQGIRPGCP